VVDLAGARRSAALVGRALVGILFLIALLAPLLAPHDPIEQDLISRNCRRPGCRAAK